MYRYEIVVGRTPFEENDKEEFLTKEALEIYYQRTLTNEFFGQVYISKGVFFFVQFLF